MNNFYNLLLLKVEEIEVIVETVSVLNNSNKLDKLRQ